MQFLLAQISILAISIIIGIFGASAIVVFLLHVLTPKPKGLPPITAAYKGRR